MAFGAKKELLILPTTVCLLMKVSYEVIDRLCTDEATKLIVKNKIKTFEQIANEIPVFIIHELVTGDYGVVYMSPRGLEGLGITLEEVVQMGPKYYSNFFDTDEVVNYISSWAKFVKDDDNKGLWFTSFQEVKLQHNPSPLWFMSASTVIASDPIDNSPLFGITIALPIHQQLPFTRQLNRLVGENKFLKENIHIFSTLTKKEREILAMIAKGRSPKAIANELIVSEDTIRTHRKNIKKKLQVKSEAELVYFAQAFNLI